MAKGDGRGGARKGAGRKSTVSRLRPVDPKVINAGKLPLEMILEVARAMWDCGTDDNGHIVDLVVCKEAAEFAKDALRYTSAQLQSFVPADESRSPEILARQIKAALDGMESAVPEAETQ